MRTILKPRERPKADLVKELALFLKERTEPDPEGVIARDDFNMEFRTFVEAKGFRRPKRTHIDIARGPQKIRLRSGLRVHGIDYDGEVFGRNDGWRIRGFLGLRWKFSESLRLRSSNFDRKLRGKKFRALSNFKRVDN